MSIQPPRRTHHHIGRHALHAQLVLFLEMQDQAIFAFDGFGKPLRCIINDGKAVPAGRQEATRFGNRVGSIRFFFIGIVGGATVAVSQRQLFLAISGVEPQDCLGKSGIAGRDIGHFQLRKIDIREHRVLQHRLQTGSIFFTTITGQIGHIDLVGAREAEQHVGCKGPLIALQQGDIGWAKYRDRRPYRPGSDPRSRRRRFRRGPM